MRATRVVVLTVVAIVFAGIFAIPILSAYSDSFGGTSQKAPIRPTLSVPLRGLATPTPHDPIKIEGNANFTSANGVVSGKGTSNNPYILSNWVINASAATGIDVRNTTAYFTIQDVQICCGGSNYDGIHFANVIHGSIQGTTVSLSREGFVLNGVQDIHITGGGVRTISEAIRVDAANNVNVSQILLSSNAGYAVDASNVGGLDLWGDQIIDAPSGGIGLSACWDVRIGQSNLTNPGPGVYASVVTSLLITGNTVTSQAGTALWLDGVRWANLTGNTVTAPSRYGTNAVLITGSNTTLSANVITGGDSGVQVTGGSQDVAFVRNRIAGTLGYGLDVEGTLRIGIRGNNFTGDAHGTFLASSWFADIEANTFSRNGIVLWGPYPDYFRTHTITPDNRVDGKPILYRKDCTGVALDHVAAGEIIVANCTGVRVSNVTLGGSDVGIETAFSQNVTLADSTLANETLYGVVFQHVANGTLDRVTVVDTGQSVDALGVSGFVVRGSAFGRSPLGVEISGTGVRFEANAVEGNGVGLYLHDVSAGLVSGNRFESNRATSDLPQGTAMLSIGSASVTVTGNTFRSNTGGLDLSGGTAGFLVYRNNFTANARQASDDNAPANAWDDGYPIGGNNWSDYNGWDDCHDPLQDNCTAGDGLGDIPYSISGGAIDRYPLIARNPPNVPPVAVIQVATPTVGIGEPLTFHSLSYDPDWSYLAGYFWTFGDGTNSAWTDPTHTYAALGSYTVTLTVTDVRRATNSASVRITVTAAGPSLTTFLSGSSVLLGATITETATLSGGYSPTIAGSVAFKAYGPADPSCGGAATFTSASFPISGSPASVGPATFTPDVAGTWHVRALFTSSDPNNLDAASLCSEGVVAVRALPNIPLVNYTSPRGYIVPVPSDWSRQYDATLGGSTYELFLQGSVEGAPANMLVDSEAAAGLQETEAYLNQAVQTIVQGVQKSFPDAALNGPAHFETVSGHLAATFEIGYSAHPIFQDVLLIVSQAHAREWNVIMTGTTSEHEVLPAAFAKIVAGFVITLAPTPTILGLPILVVGGIVGGAAAAAVVAVVLVLRARKGRPPQPPIDRGVPPPPSEPGPPDSPRGPGP